MSTPSISVAAHGAVVTGKATGIVREMLVAMRDEIAQQTFAEVHRLLDKHIKNPTPYYETQILNEVIGTDRVIHDRGIIYGPWLEGISSRNRTTRFKGYHSFRDARDSADRDAQALIQAVLRKYAGRL